MSKTTTKKVVKKMSKREQVIAKVKKQQKAFAENGSFKSPKGDAIVEFLLKKGQEGASYDEITTWANENDILGKDMCLSTNVRSRMRKEFSLCSNEPSSKNPDYAMSQYIDSFMGNENQIVELNMKPNNKGKGKFRLFAFAHKC